jgi:hypothetical protein
MFADEISPFGRFDRWYIQYLYYFFREVYPKTAYVNFLMSIFDQIEAMADTATTEEIINEITRLFNEAGLTVERPQIALLVRAALDADPSGNAAEDIVNDVTETVEEASEEVEEVITETTETVNNDIDSQRIDLDDILATVADLIVQDVLDGQAALGDVIEGSLSDISGGIDDNRGILGEILDFITDRVEVEITNEIVIPSDVFDVIVEGIGDIVAGERTFLEGVLGIFSDTIETIIGDVIDQQEPAIQDIAKAIREQTAQEDENDDRMFDLVEEVTEGEKPGIGRALIEGMNQWVESVQDGRRSGISDAWLVGFSEDVFQSCDAQELEAWIESKGVIEGTAGKLVYEIMEVVGKAMGLISIGSALGQKELAEFSRCSPWQILQPGDALAAWHHGAITYDEFVLELKFNGYNDARIEALVEAGRQVPDIAALYSMNLRGLPSGANLIERFKELGYSPQDAEALADLKFYIPPPQDLITMAVRDVFNPERVAEFKQNEDFPEEFAFWAEQQGISRDWAEKYWQAHWVLPSVQMGYEMLHRRVIDEQQLRNLMSAQDIIPGWRDALIAISYSPYTRVDIRRMYDVGVLDEQQVFEAYQDIGYDKVKARTLTDFTVELAGDDDELPDELEGITRSSVIASYKDGVIDRTTADELLDLVGVGVEARAVYLTSADLDIDREERLDEVDLILTEYENGARGLLSAQLELNNLPLTQLEKEKTEKKLRRIRVKKVKMPTKAQLDKFFSAGLIDDEEYEDQLERMGYPDTYIRKFRQLIEAGVETDA